MQYRKFGRTYWKVSTVSFGAWAIGGTWGDVDDDESMMVLLECARIAMKQYYPQISKNIEDLEDNIELNDVGYLMALTANPDINKFAINKFQTQFGENGSFRLISVNEMQDPNQNPKAGLFSHTDDFVSLAETVRKYPKINEITLNDKEHYNNLIEITKKEEFTIPLFIKNEKGILEIISSYSIDNKVEKGYKLVYLGKQIKT